MTGNRLRDTSRKVRIHITFSTGKFLRSPWEPISIIWFDAEVRAGRRPNAKALQEKFEFSESTARRLIHFCRDTLHAPLEYDWQRKGFYYRDDAYLLPLLQPRQEDMFAVLLARNLLAATAGGLISREIDRFGRRLLTATTPMGLTPESIADCFSAQWHGHSPADEPIFRTVTTASRNRRRNESMSGFPNPQMAPGSTRCSSTMASSRSPNRTPSATPCAPTSAMARPWDWGSYRWRRWRKPVKVQSKTDCLTAFSADEVSTWKTNS